MTLTDQQRDERAPEPGNDKPVSEHRRALVEWVVVLVLALVAALLIKTFAIQAFYIPSPSMFPTLKPGDRVLVNKLSYDFHPVREGDIVVFRRPPGDDSPGIDDLIKRVIGLPGETIQVKNCGVYIDGSLLKPALPAQRVAITVVPVLHHLEDEPAQPVHRPLGGVLRDGRQPQRLLRFEVLGRAARQLHRWARLRADVASQPARLALDAAWTPCPPGPKGPGQLGTYPPLVAPDALRKIGKHDSSALWCIPTHSRGLPGRRYHL